MVRFTLTKRLEIIESAAARTIPAGRDNRMQELGAVLRADAIWQESTAMIGDTGHAQPLSVRLNTPAKREAAKRLAVRVAAVYDAFEQGVSKDG